MQATVKTAMKSAWAAGFLLAFAATIPGSAQDADEDEMGGGGVEQVASEGTVDLAPQVVTGTRMIGGDPSAKVISFSAEEISRRGISSLEDLFRTLPYAFSSINTGANMTFGGGAFDTDVNIGALGLGTSTVNLRAFGSANTLVLMDGRRIATNAGSQDNFVNILNIPLAAIERVEIQLDGASAVYGADAIGGVVNFITKDNFRGLTATVRNEWSATDSDRRKLDFLSGFSWGIERTGNVVAILSRQEDKPVNNRKLWTSNDFRDDFGAEFDRRSTTGFNQPGVVCEFNGRYSFPDCAFPRTYLQLPSGSGVGARPEDFSSEIKPFDIVRPENGADATTNSINIKALQNITDSFRIYASIGISERDDNQRYLSSMRYLIPESNAYNPFGRDVVVSYYPLRELQDGRIPWSYTETENKQRNYAAGFYWELRDGHQLQLDISHSESRKRGWQIRTDWRRSRWDPTAETFYRALESSDPAVALNLFGDGTVQGSAFKELFTNALGPSLGFTDITIAKPYVTGEVFDVWGGPLRYVVGGEVLREKVYSYSTAWGQEGQVRAFGRETFEGVEKPVRENLAWYAELGLPLVTADNSRPGLRSLHISVQARRDNHKYRGARGGTDGTRVPATREEWRPGAGWTEVRSSRFVNQGEPNIVGQTKADTTWRAGLYWQPVEELTVRSSWVRTFKPPRYQDLFNISNALEREGYFRDPDHPEGVTDYIRPRTIYSSFNPDIKSETGETIKFSMDWSPRAAPNLTFSADWSRAVHKDRIYPSTSILYDHPEVGFKLKSIVERDSDGYITLVRSSDINLSEKINEFVELYGEYSFETSIGFFNPKLTYTRILDENFTVVEGSPAIDRVGTIKGSDEYRLHGSVTWLWGRFAADLFVDYIPSYLNDRTGICYEVVGRCSKLYEDAPTLEVDSLTTVDLTLTYQFDNGLRLRGGGRNILYEKSYTVFGEFNPLPYDPTRWDPRGRVLFLELQYNWGDE